MHNYHPHFPKPHQQSGVRGVHRERPEIHCVVDYATTIQGHNRITAVGSILHNWKPIGPFLSHSVKTQDAPAKRLMAPQEVCTKNAWENWRLLTDKSDLLAAEAQFESLADCPVIGMSRTWDQEALQWRKYQLQQDGVKNSMGSW